MVPIVEARIKEMLQTVITEMNTKLASHARPQTASIKMEEPCELIGEFY